MGQLLTAAQMRAVEAAAIASGKVTGLELMERAGRGVVDAVFEQWPELTREPHHAVVLCGPGNNGGDGFVVARLLKEWGWEIELFLYGDPGKLPRDAMANCVSWASMAEIHPLGNACGELGDRKSDLVVDAVFGTGLTRPLTPDVARALSDVQRWSDRQAVRTPVVAVDMPSGLCSDSGRNMGAGLCCDLTVTFHGPKPGHYLGDGPARCGKIRVVDIGLPAPDRIQPVSSGIVLQSGPGTPLGKHKTHKFDYGHALIVSGGPGRGGAGRLAARGALRIGAGLVTLGCPPAALQENAAQLNAVMTRPLASDADLSQLLGRNSRVNALCLGPGLGTGARERLIVAAALAAGRPVVLDADALTLIAHDTGLFAALHGECVLTPHMGEFVRLFPDIAKRLDEAPADGPAYSKVDAAREAARRAGCTLLLKGPDTVTAAPDGECLINAAHYDRAAPWLATAGSGDVLAGFITGLLARGVGPLTAAAAAAWLHVECALAFGPGLVSEDLPEMLPGVFRGLGV